MNNPDVSLQMEFEILDQLNNASKELITRHVKTEIMIVN